MPKCLGAEVSGKHQNLVPVSGPYVMGIMSHYLVNEFINLFTLATG